MKVGDPVVLVVQLSSLEISFRADEKYKSRIYLNQIISIAVSAYPGRQFSGEIFFISPEVDVRTRSFLVKGRISNEKKLLSPGMFAELTIITETHKDALVAPRESIIQLEDEVYLYKIKADSAEKVPVRLGLVSEGVAEVFGNLKPGDKVVIEGKYALHQGARIEIKNGSSPKKLVGS